MQRRSTDDQERQRRRDALAAAYAEVTTGRRVYLSADLSVPEVLMSKMLTELLSAVPPGCVADPGVEEAHDRGDLPKRALRLMRGETGAAPS